MVGVILSVVVFVGVVGRVVVCWLLLVVCGSGSFVGIVIVGWLSCGVVFVL